MVKSIQGLEYQDLDIFLIYMKFNKMYNNTLIKYTKSNI
jgi:hypothetical protein